MKFTCLLENTTCDARLTAEHGLSVLAETPHHTLLFDTGATGVFADNAAALGVDLKAVDTAILSHGHYDHGGGLRRFLSENETAPVWLHRQAFVLHRALHGDELADIGLDPALREEPRLRFVDADTELDDELTLLTGVAGDALSPRANETRGKRQERPEGQEEVRQNPIWPILRLLHHAGVARLCLRDKEVGRRAH